jgi:DNA-binding transcriptional ArsR family regulator
MAAAATQASELLKAIGHPHRLMLLCQMIERERTVGELAAALGIRESTTSQHLALLRKDGLVQPRREAQTIWYSIASLPAQRIMATLFELFCAPEPLCAPPDTSASSSQGDD